MRIGIDLLWVRVGICGGTESYIRNLMDGLAENAPEQEYVLFAARDNAESFRHYEKHSCMRLHVCGVDCANQVKRILWENLHLDREAAAEKIDVMFIPVYSMPKKHGSGIPYISVIHDLQALHYPQYFSKVKKLFLKYTWYNTCRNADRVVTISDYCKEDLIAHYPFVKDKISTIYNPVITQDSHMEPFAIEEKYGITQGNYFYCVSSMLPHKNLATILKVMALRKKECQSKESRSEGSQNKGVGIPLVISGVGGQKDEFNAMAEQLGISDLVIDTGFVSNEERDCLYENCRLFLFPSVFEGFGMPPVEAMRKGKTVVMTRESCLGEVTENKAVYVDKPYDEKEWNEKIEAALKLPEKKYDFPRYELSQVAQEYGKVFQETRKKILFLTCNGIEDAAFGGAKASIRNYELLKKYAPVDVISVQKRSNLASMLSILQGYFPPISRKDLQTVKAKLREGGYSHVFFDGSHFGTIVKTVKRKGVKTLCFFHNCEYDYIEVRFGQGNSLKKSIYKHLIARQEKLAAQYADCNIVFTKRDAERIRELYGVELPVIVPLTLPDIYRECSAQAHQGKVSQRIESIKGSDNEAGQRIEGIKSSNNNASWRMESIKSSDDETGQGTENIDRHEKTCLLFGPVGQANEEAFGWFVTNVSPSLHCITRVAGKGFEAYKDKWSSDKVEVQGYVEDVAVLYAEADCVAIPLLSGGGMKIKTAEALMFGKTIFGTDEAFVGYELEPEKAGGCCNSAEKFIEAINRFADGEQASFNSYSRQIYEEKYSLGASEKAFGEILGVAETTSETV